MLQLVDRDPSMILLSVVFYVTSAGGQYMSNTSFAFRNNFAAES